MSGDNCSSKGRTVLGDATNRPLKRDFTQILGGAISKSRDAKGRSRVLGENDSEFAGHVSSGIENLLKEKLLGKGNGVGIEKIVSFLKGGRDLDVSATSTIHSVSDPKGDDAKAPQSSDPAHGLEGLGTTAPDNLNLIQVSDEECQEEEGVAPMVTENSVPGGSVSNAPRDADKDLSVGKLASNKFGSIEWSRLPTNSPARSSELETCKLLKDPDTCNDPLGGCSCSFCLKAAYILSDLHYQDIKGRITALRKSQKEASSLVQKIGKGKDLEVRNASKPSELESNLFSQWKSLFLHMEGVLSQESNQLQANYIALKDLRENCKMDLEAINRTPLNKD